MRPVNDRLALAALLLTHPHRPAAEPFGAATTVTGRDGHVARAIPVERLVETLARFGRLEQGGSAEP